ATTHQPKKTFGINKHGTLLSSQTTDQQPGTTPRNRDEILFRSVPAISRFPLGDLLSVSRLFCFPKSLFHRSAVVGSFREAGTGIRRIRHRRSRRSLATVRLSFTSVPDPHSAHKRSATAQR
ncbi:hypothetical protein ACH9DO_14595, partial [Kocuria sp. M1N1S27]|uniref:hypothetical protein n=1 Tax=Kocuria kalidii TaxID=3376283 RepID=UPI0037872BB8